MNIGEARVIEPGTVLTYDDGRKGHKGIKAVVLTVADQYLIAQFEDRADVTKVEFVDDWLRYLKRMSLLKRSPHVVAPSDNLFRGPNLNVARTSNQTASLSD